VHGTGETVKSVVVEQLPVVVAKAVAEVVATLLWAFADTVDNIATARPATKSDTAFMAISPLFRDSKFHPDAFCAGLTIAPIASGLHLKTGHCFQIRPLRVETGHDRSMKEAANLRRPQTYSGFKRADYTA
jgi:hypothetical protein